jgi:RNAse (barnase) inhibitor barstar
MSFLPNDEELNYQQLIRGTQTYTSDKLWELHVLYEFLLKKFQLRKHQGVGLDFLSLTTALRSPLVVKWQTILPAVFKEERVV